MYHIEKFSDISFLRNSVISSDDRFKKILPEHLWSSITPKFIQNISEVIENQLVVVKSLPDLYLEFLKHFYSGEGPVKTWYFPVNYP